MLERVYFVVALLLVVSVGLSGYALFSNSWVEFSSERVNLPIPMSITYGLFQKCYSWNNKCVRFPDPKAGDCDADGTKFCDLWQLARIGMVLAAVHGVTIFVYTLATLFSRPLVQRRRWGKTVMGLIIHMGMAGLTLGVVGHLFNSADRFRVGTGLGASYITTLVAVILDTFAALILTTAVLNSPPEYQPIMY